MKKTSDVRRLYRFYADQPKGQCLKLFEEDDSIKQIVLIRHGEPLANKERRWYKRDELTDYFKRYDESEVLPFEYAPICKDLKNPVVVYHSSLPRARSSAQLIFGNQYEMIEDDRFRELEREAIPIPSNAALPLSLLTKLSRAFWFFGWHSDNLESYEVAKQRCADNAVLLSGEARLHDTVVLVAHGFHNLLISRYLKAMDWNIVYKGGRDYWAVNILANQQD